MASAGFALAGTIFLGYSAWRADSALRDARRQSASAASLPFTLTPISNGLAARFSRPFQSENFGAAAAFDGDLFVCGRSALTRYGANGAPKQSWFPGEALPSHPLNGLAVRRGTGVPELWISTEGGGVVIFDGQSFRQLLPSESALRNVAALLPLGNGNVLLGTNSAGLYLTDTKHLRLLHPQFSRTEVTALAGDEDNLWVGTRRDGCWLWRAGQAVHFLSELPDPQVLSIYASGDSAWVGTPLGVAELAQGRFRRPLAAGIFAQALTERSGELLIGTLDQGLISIPLQPRTRSVPGGTAHNFTPDAGQHAPVLSFAQFGRDLLAISPGNVERTGPAEAVLAPRSGRLASEHITALAHDNRGRLWVGYFDRGLDVMGQGSGTPVVHQENDVLFCINRIKMDARRGITAVATANGLVLFDAAAAARQTITARNGTLSNHVTDILFRQNGDGQSTLVAATPAGLSFLDDGEPSGISAFQGLVNNHAYTIAEYEGAIFAGTLGGLSLVRQGLVEASYTTANSALHQNWITASAVDGDFLYLGTYGSGVVQFDRRHNLTSFHEFEQKRVEINPNAMLATASALYAGTAAQGLAILWRGQSRWQFVSQGLPSANVTALAARNGVLYIGTDNGLVTAEEQRFRP